MALAINESSMCKKCFPNLYKLVGRLLAELIKEFKMPARTTQAFCEFTNKYKRPRLFTNKHKYFRID